MKFDRRKCVVFYGDMDKEEMARISSLPFTYYRVV
jgi:hypothetical protein